MKPLVAAYLVKARRSLKEAHAVAALGAFPEAAGRAAYIAAYNAAQAYILEHTGKIAKTHSGVRSEFARLAKDDRRVDRGLPTFLARAYNLKSFADYAVEFEVSVSAEDAAEAIGLAETFVRRIGEPVTT